MTGNIANDGLMEADGANLYFTGATIDNRGTFSVVDNESTSKLIFLNGTTQGKAANL